MRYLVLATDYDGTLAEDGRVSPAVLGGLERLRASGHRLVLVTGRLLDDVVRVCPELDLFDRVVAENGAILYRTDTREKTALGRPPPAAFEAALRDHGVSDVQRGEVIVATREPHQTSVLEAIRALGLELQVIFNKGAVMVLPSGVNKGTGLAAALADLGLSRHNAVGVGDGENDHALLADCECAVAVADALPSLKAEADWVTPGGAGAGVLQLAERLLQDDLASLEPRLARRALLVGRRRDGSEVRAAPFGTCALVAGPSGSGKTTAASALVERLAEADYQCCVIDPEGDYEGFGPMVSLGGGAHAPTATEVLEVLASPKSQVAVNLLGIQRRDRPRFFQQLLPRLLELRAETGRPHWIILDEAHHLLPTSWQPMLLPSDLGGFLLVTLQPEELSRQALAAVNLAVAVGDRTSETMRSFFVGAGRAPPPKSAMEAGSDEALVWSSGSAAPEPVRLAEGRTSHLHHRRKYAVGDLGEKAFRFRGRQGQLDLRAPNLETFLQLAEGLDDETWVHHFTHGDYSRWFREGIKDDGLAEEAVRIEAEPALSAAEARRRFREAIERRYAM